MRVKLGDIYQITSGGTPKKGNPEYYENGSIPWIKTGDLKGKNLESYETITESGLQNSSAKLFPENTVLLAMYGATIGNCAILDFEASTNQACAAFLPNDLVLPEYLYYFLLGKKKQFIKDGVGGAQPNISATYLKKVNFELISIEEQIRIVSVLDKLSGIIDNRAKQLQTLDELIKARFVEMFGDPLLGNNKWPIHAVGIVAESVDPQPSHRTPPVDENGIPYISIKDCDYKTGTIDFEHARRVGTHVLEEHLQRYELHNGDFIIGKIGTIGNPVFVPARKDYTLSANIVLIQPNKQKVAPYFLKYSFMSAYMEHQFADAKNSTSQAAFGIQKVRTMKVLNPPLELQYQFEDFAKQIDKSKVVVQKALDKAQLLFDSLMQQYFGLNHI